MVCGIMRLCAVRVWVCVCVSQRVLRMALKEWNGGNGAGEAPGRPQSFNWRRGSNVANFRSTPDCSPAEPPKWLLTYANFHNGL